MRAVAARASAAPAPRRAARTVKAARNVRVQSSAAYGASGTSFYTTTEKQRSWIPSTRSSTPSAVTPRFAP